MGSHNYQEELSELLGQQKRLLERYTQIIEAFAEEDIAGQNHKLKQENEALKQQIQKLQLCEVEEKTKAEEKIVVPIAPSIQQVSPKVEEIKQIPIQPILMLPPEQENRGNYVPEKKHNIELRIGLNWINKIGIILILIGVIIGMRYSYIHFFTPELKGVLGALLGGLFLGIGGYFYKKEKKVFATGITGGGIAILYITIFVGYFTLQIVNRPMAIILSILVSILSFVLCHLYHSQTVGVFALVGGYLPIIAYAVLLGEVNQMSALLIASYILLLNFVTVGVSFKKNWPLVGYISFAFNIPATVWCTVMLVSQWEIIVYLILNFVMYLAIVFAHPFVYKTKLSVGHIVLTAINTTLSSVLLCAVLSVNGFDEQFGIVCAGFALVYFGLERLSKKYLPEEESMRLVFYITALTFVILIIPFQLNGVWILMGWVIQGVLFVIYGRKKRRQLLEMSGIGLIILSTVIYYFLEPWNAQEVWWKYGILLGALMTTMIIYLKAMESGELDNRWDALVVAYECFVLFNIVNYIQYNLCQGLQYVLDLIGSLSDLTFDMRLVIVGSSILVVAIAIERIGLLRKSLPRYMSISLYGIVAVVGVCVSLYPYGMSQYSENIPVEKLLYTMIMGGYHLLVIWSAFAIARVLKVKGLSWAKTSSLIAVIYVVFDLQLFVIYSWLYDHTLAQVVLSISCAIIAWRLIIVGFKQHFKGMRYCGLGLVTYAFGKLFLYDMSQLGSGYSIISFFGFGIVLIAISYVYQKFAKIIEE